nr:MAG TPA: hypothetical protein [Caudoviricetes sp.]
MRAFETRFIFFSQNTKFRNNCLIYNKKLRLSITIFCPRSI